MTKVIDADTLPYIGFKGNTWDYSPLEKILVKNTWYALKHGNIKDGWEISVCHFPENEHGFISYGWKDKYKIIVSESHEDQRGMSKKWKKIHRQLFEDALEKAVKIADALNSK